MPENDGRGVEERGPRDKYRIRSGAVGARRFGVAQSWQRQVFILALHVHRVTTTRWGLSLGFLAGPSSFFLSSVLGWVQYLAPLVGTCTYHSFFSISPSNSFPADGVLISTQEQAKQAPLPSHRFPSLLGTWLPVRQKMHIIKHAIVHGTSSLYTLKSAVKEQEQPERDINGCKEIQSFVSSSHHLEPMAPSSPELSSDGLLAIRRN